MKTLTCKMKQLILQIETIFRVSSHEIENKPFNLTVSENVTRSQILIFFKNWVDSLILKIIPNSTISYPYENRTDEITDIDYNSKEELYTFFTSFLNTNSLRVLGPFIKTLTNTIYIWPSVFDYVIESFYTNKICSCSPKTKLKVNYSKLKLYSSLLFYVIE